MAAVTQKNEENKPLAADDEENSASDSGQDSSDQKRPPGGSPRVGTKAGDGGFFHIYKRGQGYWTRMGTVAAAALIGLLTCGFIFDQCEQFSIRESVTYSIIAVFAAAFGLLGFYLFNRPDSVDFLIATDSEMKKVNWTSKKELIGSTKVVIGFMFFMAITLFLYDMIFHTIFYLMHILKTPPPFFPQH